MAQHKTEIVAASDNGNAIVESKTISTENGLSESQDKDVVSEGLGAVSVYDQWVSPPISGTRPKARYEVLEFNLYHFLCMYLFYICSTHAY